MQRKALFLILCLILCGCSLGPSYVPPPDKVPAKWTMGPGIEKPYEGPWWRNFHDPMLNELIEQQSVTSLPLKIAKALIEKARADYEVAKAQQFPTVNLNLMPMAGAGFLFTQYAPVILSVDPDLLGKRRLNKAMHQFLFEASEADERFAMINLYTEIATAYMGLRQTQAVIKNLKKTIKGSQLILDFNKSKYKRGYINYIGVAQQSSFIEMQAAELEKQYALQRAAISKIETLTNQAPGALREKLLFPKPLPKHPQYIPLDIPSSLLRRRPDIQAAERRIAAAHTNIRIAMTSLFPQLSVGWLWGWQIESVQNNVVQIKNPNSMFYGGLNAPLFDYGLYKMVDVRKREKMITILQYRLAILNALQEVETQYYYCKHYKKGLVHWRRALQQKALALKLNRELYLKGATNFEVVLHTEEDFMMYQNSFTFYDYQYLIAQVNLYKALGGDIPKQTPAPE